MVERDLLDAVTRLPRVTPHLHVKGIEDQADKLQEVDREDYIYDVLNFKRAVATCEVKVDDEIAPATIIVDFRAGSFTVSMKHPKMKASDFGMKLLIVHAYRTGEKDALIERVGFSVRQTNDVAEFPIGRYPEQFRGFLHYIKQQGWTKIEPGLNR